jgi:hypothetical protein
MILALCLLAAAALAQEEKMRIAIVDLEARGVDAMTAQNVSDLLRTELFNTGLFRVIERSQMEALLAEQELQASGCTDTECAVQMGKMLACDKMLLGSVMKMGDALIINARIVDVEKAEMEFGDKANAENLADLQNAVAEFARRLAKRIRRATPAASGGTTTPAADTPRGKTVRPLKLPAIICLGLGGAALAGGGTFELLASSAHEEGNSAYEAYEGATDPDTATTEYDRMMDARDRGNQMGRIGLYCLSGGGALAVAGAVMLFIKKSDNLSLHVIPEKNGAAVLAAARF